MNIEYPYALRAILILILNTDTRITPNVMRPIRPERKFPVLLYFPLGTLMFHFPRCAPSYKGTCRKQVSFLIRTSPVITIVWHLTGA